MAPVADPPVLTDSGFVDTAHGTENQPIALFNATIPPDPSETLAVTITGVPAGGSFEINGVAVGAAGSTPGTWVISDPAQTALLATSPLQFVSSTAGTFTLHVDAQSIDTATLSTGPATSTADTIQTINVTVDDINDVTLHNPSAITVVSGTTTARASLGIQGPIDPDQAPGEQDIITIQAVPAYGVVQYFDGTHFVQAVDGTVLTSTELQSLQYLPPATGSFHGDSIVYSVQDGPSLVDGSIAITVSDPPGADSISRDCRSATSSPISIRSEPTTFRTAIPLNAFSNTGSDAG